MKDQDDYLQPACADMATKYAGSADVITQKKLTHVLNTIKGKNA